MDKFEYELKVEQIEKLIRRNDFSTAKKISDTMDWRRERDFRLLAEVAELYVQAGDYSQALKLLSYAYDNAPIGRLIIGRMTEVAIIAGRLDDAEEFCREFHNVLPKDPDYYLYRFQIAEGRGGENLSEMISCLEQYCRTELDEEWMCRLAYLYDQAGRGDDCVRMCDRIILWFCFGEYVDLAMQLKQKYAPLDRYQQQRKEQKAEYEENYLRYLEQYEKNQDERTRRQDKQQVREEQFMEKTASELGQQVAQIVEVEKQEKEQEDIVSMTEPEILFTPTIDIEKEMMRVREETASQAEPEAEKAEEAVAAETDETAERASEEEGTAPEKPDRDLDEREKELIFGRIEPEEILAGPEEMQTEPENEEALPEAAGEQPEEETEEAAEEEEEDVWEELKLPEETKEQPEEITAGPEEVQAEPESEEDLLEAAGEQPEEAQTEPENEEASPEAAGELPEEAEPLYEEPEGESEEEEAADEEETVRFSDEVNEAELLVPYGSFAVVSEDVDEGTRFVMELLKKVPEDDRKSHLARMTGAYLNREKFHIVEQQAEDCIFFIVKAGELSDASLDHLYGWLKKDGDNKLILMDSREKLEELGKRRPKLMKRISGTYAYVERDNEEWLWLMELYARENGGVLHESAQDLIMDYLEDKTERDDLIMLLDLKEAVQDALDQAARPSFGNLLAGVLGRRYDEDGLLILKERHFL